ncbi:hypothetical protein CDD83_5821 [Cordyceps sp. RAO-2017]|nr:hypothetical protein CDD83_5821 [Cordyceps sp. RAO-2017]
MLFSKALLPLALLASSVVGDGNTIRVAMKRITGDTADLGKTVSSWHGDLFGALPVVGKAAALLASLKHGTHTARASTALTTDETLVIATSTQELSDQVNKTLQAVIDAKPKFDHLFVSPLIHLTLEVEKGAADDFSNALLKKVPKDLQSIAEELIKGIMNNFQKALDAYA